MSNNKRWDTDEKIKLMKAFSEGKSYDEIGKLLSRSANAIKLRLESIVYDNLTNGKSMNVLTRMLHTEPDTIKQLYYSHKSFLQARGEEVVDVDFTKNNTIDVQNNKIIPQSTTQSTTQSTNQSTNQSTTQPTNHSTNQSKNHSTNQSTNQSTNLLINQSSPQQKRRSMLGSGKQGEYRSKMERLEKENHAMEQIIKNYKMKRQLRKLYANDKLDEKSAIICDRILK